MRGRVPDLAVHASTQMTCTDAAGVELARSLGARRVILARELSLGDIAAIRAQTDTELEVFVHGALCIAYSGQCLTSEAIGGRSANRGACAQACRLPYELMVDGAKRDLGDKAYLLSPEDLDATAVIPDLVKLGIASLKIEGRLKGADYVAATTKLYRAAIRAAMETHEAIDPKVHTAALQTYSRGSGPGFLAGVDHQRLVEGNACDHRGVLAGTLNAVRHLARGRAELEITLAIALARGDGLLVEGGFAGAGEVGGRVWGIEQDGRDVERAERGARVRVWLGPDKAIDAGLHPGRRVWKTSDPTNEREILAAIEQNPHRVEVSMRLRGGLGEHPILEATSARGAVASVTVDAAVEKARMPGTFEGVAREKLGRLGDSPFVLGALQLEVAPDAMVPPAALNRARRAVVTALLGAAQHTLATQPVSSATLLERALPGDRPIPPPGLFVLCRTLPQAEAAMDAGATGVYLDFLELTGTGNAVRALRARGPVHVTLAPPRIRKPGEEKIDRFLHSLEPDAMLVRGLGSLHDDGGSPVPRIGDFSLNVTNRIAIAEVMTRKLQAFTPSLDLDAAQLVALLNGPWAPFAEVVVHQPMPLFHMEHCVFAALLSSGHDHRDCGRPCERHQLALRDRAGMDHPVEADVGCRNTVFHAAAQSAAGVVGSLQQHGVKRFRIELVRESASDVHRLVETYRGLLEGTLGAPDVWRTLKTDAGYGIVRGSLRVLDRATA